MNFFVEFSINSEHYYSGSHGEEERTEFYKKKYKITEEGKITDLQENNLTSVYQDLSNSRD